MDFFFFFRKEDNAFTKIQSNYCLESDNYVTLTFCLCSRCGPTEQLFFFFFEKMSTNR